MNRKIKKHIAKIVALTLIIAVTAVFMPQMKAMAYAASGDPAIVVGSETALKKNVNHQGAASIVWYADNAWDLINYNGEQRSVKYTFEPYSYFDNTKRKKVWAHAMTLLSTGNMGDALAIHTDRPSNDYEGSYLKKFVDGLFTSLFSDEEKQAVIERELIADEYDGKHDCIGVSGMATKGYLWPLSTAEVRQVDTLRGYPNQFQDPFEESFWLRSPGNRQDYMAFLEFDTKSSSVDFGRFVVNNEGETDFIHGVRPAFNLNLDSILFTSAAEGGKNSRDEGADALQAISANNTNEWKLTLKDDGTVGDPCANGKLIAGLSGHKDFNVRGYTVTATGVTLRYAGAKTGANEYISVIITDRPITEAGANITYYGRIKNCASDKDVNGKIIINTANKLGTSDTLYVFNEQYNGDKKTDYASALQDVTPHPMVGRVSKASNPLKIKGRTATVKYSKLKKKNQTLAVTKVIRFTNKGQGTKTYTLASAKKGKKSFKKYFKVNKTSGKLTVKKGLKKGTYKVKIKVKAAGNKNYKAVTKAVTVTVKVRE